MEAGHEAYLAHFMAHWGMDAGDGSEPPQPPDLPPVEVTEEASLEECFGQLTAVLNRQEEELNKEEAAVALARERFQHLQAFINQRFRPNDQTVDLNILGHTRAASVRVLCQFPDSLLAPLFSGDRWTRQAKDLDADGRYILNQPDRKSVV